MSGMKRRDVLGRSACLLMGAAIDTAPIIARAVAATSSSAVERFGPPLARGDGEIYARRSGGEYDRLATYYNKRFECVTPEIIVYCRSIRAVAKSIRWCRENAVAFSIRSGGHCYEGSSRSNQVVIDLRGLCKIAFDPRNHAIQVGGGATLGDVYTVLARAAQAIPAGTCPTIGIAGHALAGGLGFLVRQFGLACDNIRSIEIANADGDIDVADEKTNSDLFWALRGAGQASFGVVTKLEFRTHSVPRVTTCEYETTASQQKSARFLSRWQGWIGDAADSVSSSVFMQKKAPEKILVQLRGTILGNESVIRRQLENILRELQEFPRPRFNGRSFRQAVSWFSEGEDGTPVYEKGKSDIVKHALDADAFRFLLDALPVGVDGEITALGGAVDRIAPNQAAFPHRGGANLVIQWGTSWKRPEEARAQLLTLDDFYGKIRPLMSSSAFLNYVDRDIADPARAYWGKNLERLVAVKRKYDPNNVFRHAMSVPTELPDDEPAPPAAALYCLERS